MLSTSSIYITMLCHLEEEQFFFGEYMEVALVLFYKKVFVKYRIFV